MNEQEVLAAAWRRHKDELATLRALYAEAVRALHQLRGTTPCWIDSDGPAVLSRPEAQEVLRG